MMKKVLIGLVIAVSTMVIVFTACIVWFCNLIDDSLSKKEIFSLVNEHYTVILDNISENEFTDTEHIDGVKEVYFEGSVIDVYCGGTGIGSATSYYGFYYAPDNQPKAVWCGNDFGEDSNLQPENNGFCIKSANNDNHYYTEQIRDFFYYYEAHF